MWQWHKYKKTHPNTKLYLWNMNGYGDVPVSLWEKDVTDIHGWSERGLQYMATCERGIQTFIDTIKNYRPYSEKSE